MIRLHRFLLLAVAVQGAGCGEDWCARFNLDCEDLSAYETEELIDADNDVWPEGEDCDDTDPMIYPSAEEHCDGVDNNCNGEIDEGHEVTTWYRDLDSDRYGNPDVSVVACQPPPGTTSWSPDGTDCDDTDARVNREAAERCSTPGIDDDCSGAAEDNPVDGQAYEVDADGDGAVDRDLGVFLLCETDPEGYVRQGLGLRDCDDTDPEINPEASEVCDEADVDEDCDGFADDEDPNVRSSTKRPWPIDQDGDGFGSTGGWYSSCDPLPGYTDNELDCDDLDESVYPGAPEACDEADQDCDGIIDEEPVIGPVYYVDADGDGYGTGTGTVSCSPLSGMALTTDDCDDTDARFHPGAAESDCADLADYNCDGSTGLDDVDSDGIPACLDCDDQDPARSPDAEEVCDDADLDEDCNDLADDLDPGLALSSATLWYTDLDADGYGSGSGTLSCDPPSTTAVSADGDCDESDPSVHPGAAEVCDDGIDNDCDGGGSGCVIEGNLSLNYASVTLNHSSFNEQGGTSLDWAGDLDGDGVDDAFIGSPQYSSGTGRAVVVFGGLQLSSATGSWSTPSTGRDTHLYTRTSGDHLGQAVAGLGDIDGDGYDDLVVGVSHSDILYSNNGSVQVIPGPLSRNSSSYAADLAVASIYGDRASALLGSVVGPAGDIDGDGLGDVLLANRAFVDDEPAIFLFHGDTTGAHFATDADATIGGETAASGYVTTAGDGDLNGDGISDLAIGARSVGASGQVVLLTGPLDGAYVFADADLVLEGESSQDYAGTSLSWLGDTDGDGLDDLGVGAQGVDAPSTIDSGGAYLLTGSTLSELSGTLDLSDADLVIIGNRSGDYAGTAIAGGDVDGDGRNDIAIGAPQTGTGAGRVFLVLAPGTGSLSLDAADALITGITTGDKAGTALALDGDPDANGRADLLIGAPSVSSSSGATYVLLSFGL